MEEHIVDRVECPRCGLRLNAQLHAIFATDAQACPSCLGLDDLEIPMFVVPHDGLGPSRRLRRPMPPRRPPGARA